MREQAQIAIDNATVIVLVVDIKTGMTAADQEVANMLQRSKKPIVLAVNKMDSTGPADPEFYEFYNLGLGDPIAVSAVHGHGTGDLLDACLQYFPPEDDEQDDDDVIQVAIIGKPNVGKSSLTNRILGEHARHHVFRLFAQRPLYRSLRRHRGARDLVPPRQHPASALRHGEKV